MTEERVFGAALLWGGLVMASLFAGLAQALIHSRTGPVLLPWQTVGGVVALALFSAPLPIAVLWAIAVGARLLVTGR